MKYDFDEKQSGYRIPVWNAVDAMLEKPKALRRVAYLDTADALDTVELLRRGYSSENLVAINRSPAQVAALTMRLARIGLPRVHTRGADFADYVANCGRQFDVLSFDGCGNVIGRSLRQFFTGLGAAIAESRPRVVTLTLLGGRESPEITRALRESTALFGSIRTSSGAADQQHHLARLRWVICLLQGFKYEERLVCATHVVDFRWGTYMSASGQPMVWGVLRTAPPVHRRVRDEARELRDLGVSKRCVSAGILPLCVCRKDGDDRISMDG